MVNVPPVYSSGLSCFAFALPTSSLHFADSPNKLIMLAFCREAFRFGGKEKGVEHARQAHHVGAMFPGTGVGKRGTAYIIYS